MGLNNELNKLPAIGTEAQIKREEYMLRLAAMRLQINKTIGEIRLYVSWPKLDLVLKRHLNLHNEKIELILDQIGSDKYTLGKLEPYFHEITSGSPKL